MGGKAGKEQAPVAVGPKAAAPSLQEASATLDTRIADLDKKIDRCDEEARALIAKKESVPSAKARAMQILKRKKMYEQQREQLVGTQANVENLAFQQEQAEVTLTAVEAMKHATKQLKEQKDKINVDQVDKLTDDMAELQADMQDIQEALARPLGVADDDAEEELAAEYAKLQEEQAMSILMGGGVSSTATPAPAVPAPVVAPAAAQAIRSPGVAIPS